ncbi:hypothetical protein ACHWQZ_G008842 [Mnemiopsis leidyi]
MFINTHSRRMKSTETCPENTSNHVNISSGMTLAVVYLAVLSLNSLIIFVIFRVKHRSLRWSLDYLVSFLAITDLISTLVGVPIPIIAYMQGYWPGSCNSGETSHTFSTFNISCKLFYLFLVWGRLSTMFIITMMCIERFLAITRPFIHREIVTAGRLRKCVYGIWFAMFLYSLLPILEIGHVKLHWNMHLDAGESKTEEMSYFFCFMDYSDLDVNKSSGLGNLIYSIIFALFGCISLTIVLICVFFICRILLVRRPQFSANKNKKPASASKTYSVNTPAPTVADEQTDKNRKMLAKPSMLEKSRTFLAKRRPQIKKFEPEELQFIALMLMIAGVFYVTFLPTMVLVISNIAGHGMSENFTFWSMRFTSFVVVANPLIYGFSNKLYRIGCIYVVKSFGAFFCCKTIPVPERLGPRKLSTAYGSRARLTPAEKAAQDFIIAASPDKGEAIAKAFVGKMKIGVEDDDSPSSGSTGDILNFSDLDFLELVENREEIENRRFSGISFRSGAYRKSVNRSPNTAVLEIENGKRPRIQKRKDSYAFSHNIGTMNVGRITRRLSKILSVGDRIGDQDVTVRNKSDTTPMIAEEKSLLSRSTSQDTYVPPPRAPLKKGFTRRGLREKQASETANSSRL